MIHEPRDRGAGPGRNEEETFGRTGGRVGRPVHNVGRPVHNVWRPVRNVGRFVHNMRRPVDNPVIAWRITFNISESGVRISKLAGKVVR
jgi:hypothetical protein